MGGPARIHERQRAVQPDPLSVRSLAAEPTQSQRRRFGAVSASGIREPLVGSSLTGGAVNPVPDSPSRPGAVSDFASIPVSAQPPGLAAPQHSGELSARYSPPASTGRRLDGDTRADIQARFGMPAVDVMIHADPAAAAIADQLNASAFTVDRHVVFGTGRFNPASTRGQMLLAHEIAHVVQQRGANSGRVATSPEAELEASEAAASAVLGLPIPVLSATSVGVACQGKEEEQTWRSRLWHSGAALVEKAKVEARDYIKEQVGVVEGVANEAATFVDTMVWAETGAPDPTDKVVDKVAALGGLSKEKREALRSAVQTLTNQPGMHALREGVRKAAREAHLVDPVTGAPSSASAVSRAFDWVRKEVRRDPVPGHAQGGRAAQPPRHRCA